MINKIGTFTAILFSVAVLNGCASLGANTEGDFFCEAQAGSPCATISATDGTGAGKTVLVSETVDDAFLGTLSA